MLVVFGRFLGRNELKVIPQVDFDIVSSILRVLEGWEPGKKGFYTKYLSYNYPYEEPTTFKSE